jgi:hypothetical protein
LPLEHKIIGRQVSDALAQGAAAVGFFDAARDAGDDGLRDLVLYGEDILQLPVEPLRPHVIAGRRFDQLHRDAQPRSAFRTLPSTTNRTPSSCATLRTSTSLFRYWNEEWWAITSNCRNRDKPATMSTVMPSLKYCCVAPPT